MKNKKLTLMILAAVLVLLVGGYFGLTKYNEYTEEQEGLANATQSIYTLSPSSVYSLSWDYSDTEYRVHKEGDTWIYDADPTMPVDGSVIDTMLNSICTLEYIRTVEGATNLSDYGLDEGYRKVTWTIDGTTYEYHLGNYNSTSGAHYLMTGDSDTVYMVSSTLQSIIARNVDSIRDDSAVEETEDSAENTIAEIAEETE